MKRIRREGKGKNKASTGQQISMRNTEENMKRNAREKN